MLSENVLPFDAARPWQRILGENWPRVRAYAAMVANAAQEADAIVAAAAWKLGIPDLRVGSDGQARSAMIDMLRAIPAVVNQMPDRKNDKGQGIPQALGSLSTEDRQALALRSLMALDSDMIADIMGESAEQVADRAAKAGQRIRESVSVRDEQPNVLPFRAAH